MKRTTPSDARKNWFRLLDEVAAGEVVVLERNGRRIVIRREDRKRKTARGAIPDYSSLISAPDVDQADRWGWDWSPESGDLTLRDLPQK